MFQTSLDKVEKEPKTKVNRGEMKVAQGDCSLFFTFYYSYTPLSTQLIELNQSSVTYVDSFVVQHMTVIYDKNKQFMWNYFDPPLFFIIHNNDIIFYFLLSV